MTKEGELYLRKNRRRLPAGGGGPGGGGVRVEGGVGDGEEVEIASLETINPAGGGGGGGGGGEEVGGEVEVVTLEVERVLVWRAVRRRGLCEDLLADLPALAVRGGPRV